MPRCCAALTNVFQTFKIIFIPFVKIKFISTALKSRFATPCPWAYKFFDSRSKGIVRDIECMSGFMIAAAKSAGQIKTIGSQFV